MQYGKDTKLISMLDEYAGENVSDSLLGWAHMTRNDLEPTYVASTQMRFEALPAEEQVAIFEKMVSELPDLYEFWADQNHIDVDEQRGRIWTAITGFQMARTGKTVISF